MKKILSRIFSAALITATVASPVMAQTAKKAKAGNTSPSLTSMTATAAPQKSAGKNAKELNVLPVRKASNGISFAKTGKVSRVRKAPAGAASDIPSMKGVIGFNTKIGAKEADPGYYDIAKTATAESDFLFAANGGTYGAVVVDGVLYTNEYVNLGFFALNSVYAYDVESGQQLGSFSPEGVDNLCPGGLVVDPTSGTVYGIGYNSEGSALQLAKLVYTPESVSVTPVGALAGNWNSIVCDANGQLYGINYEGETEGDKFTVTKSSLYKIDKTNAAVTLIGETGVAPQYLSSACIDSTSGRMFWNVCYADESADMCEVNLATGAATSLYSLTLADEIFGLTVPAPEAADNAPGKCDNVTVEFEGFSLSGKVNLTTPSTYYGGGAPAGTMTVKVAANGVEVGTLDNAAYGQQVSVPVAVAEAGSYDFQVYAVNANGDGPKKTVRSVWVGPDTPEATKASLQYVNGNMEVSWNAVTSTVNGGSLPADGVTYTVKRADGTVAAQGLTVTSFSEAVAEPTSLTSYYYEVYVVIDDMESNAARTNTVVVGAIVPPYTSDFAETGLEGWSVYDGNDDGKVWTVVGDEARMGYNSAMDMDDWLFTPPMKLQAGKAYMVSFSAHNNGASFPERLEVKYGKNSTPEGMTSVLVAPTMLEGAKEVYNFSEYVIPDADGTYYVGFHGMSDADQFYLFLSNVTIAEGISSAAPGAAENLVATPDPNGALKATISFKAPSKTMGGAALSSLTKVEVLRGATVVKTFDNPTVGADLSCEDTLTENGNAEYTVVGYNAEGKGLPAKATVYVGFDVPEGIESANISRTATAGEVALSWDAITKDVNGLAYPAGSVKYNVYEADGSSRTKIATVDGTSYSYQAVAAGQQDFIQCLVFPVYDDEEGAGAYTNMIAVGTPYDGLAESFPDGQLNYIWGLRAIGSGTVGIATDEQFSDLASQDGDNGYIYIKAQYLDQGADFFSGMVSLNGMQNPGLTFYTYNIVGENPDINEITVSVRTIDGANESEYNELFTGVVNEICNGQEGWGKVQVNLSAYANKTIQFQITGITKQYVYTMIDNIKVGSILSNDLKAVSVTAPAKVKCGEDYLVDVKVLNEGVQAAASYSVELYADDELVETKTMTNLASGASAVVSFDRHMSAIATEAVTYYAKVVYAADENNDNNQTAAVVVNPVVSNVPTPTSLAGACDGNGVVLNWNEPNLEGGVAEEVTDDFEDADAFAAEYGDWIFVDGDQAAVGGFQGTDVPGITPGETKGSFWIWDASQVGNQTFAAHSGNKYLYALFRYDDGTTDDWAISPELYGGAQTVKFYAKSYSSQYPEKIKVMYSTGSTDVADFVAAEGYADAVIVPGDWTLYEVDLPAGAKRFAINSCATGSFMLMVDDVTYTPASATANLELAGYNVYRDGVKINSDLVDETTYTDTNVEDGKQYTYVVTAVYTGRGESAASNEVVVTYTASGVNAIGDGAVTIKAAANSIVVMNADAMSVTVATAGGAIVFDGFGEAVKTISVAPGVYVVKVGNTVKKLVVK